jgi:hypothetical protein
MKNKFFLIKPLFFLPFLLMAAAGFSQKETYDIINYSAPQGWVRQDTTGIKIFTKENKQTGGYCIISLFKSRTASASAENDFQKAWADIVVAVYNGPDKPISEEKVIAEDGWTAISGSQLLKIESADAMVLLTVLSGKERTFSVFALLNDQTFFTDIDRFLEGLDINKDALAKANSTKKDPVPTNLSSNKKNQGTQTFDNFIYQVPEGWTSKNASTYLEVFPQQAMPEEVFSIILLKGKISNASLQQELANCWNEFAGMLGAQLLTEVSGKNYNPDEISKSFDGWDYITGHGSIRKGNDYFVHAYIIRVKERIERVIVFAKEIRLDAVRSNIDPSVHHTPYYYIITDFIFNLRFTNLQRPEISKPTWKGTGVLGTWAGIGFLGGELKTTFAIFFSNGQVFYGSRFPLFGLYELDTYADKERTQRYWGTYTFQDGKGTVKMPYASFPIRLEGDKLVMAPVNEEHKFIRMPSVDDVRLNGTWMITDENDRPVTITFRSDGTFSDKGALRILDHSIYQYYSIADNGGSGNYLVKDYTIIFNYSDGRQLRVAFPGKQFTPGNNSPKELVLSFNDDSLIKQ